MMKFLDLIIVMAIVAVIIAMTIVIVYVPYGFWICPAVIAIALWKIVNG